MAIKFSHPDKYGVFTTKDTKSTKKARNIERLDADFADGAGNAESGPEGGVLLSGFVYSFFAFFFGGVTYA